MCAHLWQRVKHYQTLRRLLSELSTHRSASFSGILPSVPIWTATGMTTPSFCHLHSAQWLLSSSRTKCKYCSTPSYFSRCPSRTCKHKSISNSHSCRDANPCFLEPSRNMPYFWLHGQVAQDQCAPLPFHNIHFSLNGIDRKHMKHWIF